MTDPTVKPINAVLERLQKVRKSGKGWKACCPAHDDRHPSLSVGIGEHDQVLLKCHTGCELEDIVTALNMELRDLWPEEERKRPPQLVRQIAEHRYPIRDTEGKLVAYHVRRDSSDGSKTFAWLQPDQKTWNLNGYSVSGLPLYGSDDLPTTANVIVTEGEKAADALRSIGIRAVATVTGASSTPDPHVLEPLLDYQAIYLWPDNDREGADHMRRIAGYLSEMGHRNVLRLHWSGAGPKADAADFVEAGNAKAEILDLAQSATQWDQSDDESEPLPELPPFHIYHAQELKQRPPPPQLIRGIIIERSHAVLFGNPGTYKSFIALEMASCIANGGLWFGYPVEQGPALYTTGEGQASFGNRIRAWEIDREETNNLWILPEAVQFPELKDIDALLWSIEHYLNDQPRLIVIDTLARSSVGLDENSAQDMGVFVAGVDRVIQEYGCSVLTVHHANKQGFYRGSSALLGAWDTVMESKKDDSGAIVVSCVKQKDLDEFKPIVLQPEPITITPGAGLRPPVTSVVMQEESSGILTRSSKIALDILVDEFPDGAQNQKWEDAAVKAGVSRATFFRCKKQLAEFGLIHISAGIYIAVNRGSYDK